MDKQRKLLIFDRREVFLIFVFMILVAVTSFTAGVKIGQKLSYQAQGFTTEDQELIKFKSWAEEDVEGIDKEDLKINEDALQNQQQETLKQKFEQIAGAEELAKAQSTKQKNLKQQQKQILDGQGKNKSQPLREGPAEKDYRGKWTIQLGSYEGIEDAQRFADGFKVRGYNPIINEVTIAGRGVWYRVGLGAFDDVAAAKQYISQEDTLFQGQDYTIVQLR